MAKRPNILIFMTDQQHYETISADSPAAMTHVMGLAERGLTFERAYTPCPQCTPARTSAVTGVYPHRHTLMVNSHSSFSLRDRLPASVPTMGEVFGEAGYRAAYAGKWHIGRTSPAEHGFELVARPRTKHPITLRDEVMPLIEETGIKPLAATTDEPVEDTPPFAVARDVVRFLEDHAVGGDGRPFLMYSSCLPPHVPWHVPEPYASMVDPESLEEPASYRDTLAGKPASYHNHAGVNFGNVSGNWPEFARAKAKYYGVCKLIDDAFGSILAALDRLGLVDNTIVVFTSDHGEFLGAHGLVGKKELACEELIRVPLVMAGPGIDAGTTRTPITLCDLFATLAAAAGVSINPPADSRDMSALFALGTRAEAEHRLDAPVFIQHHGTTFPNLIRAIRTHRWKYTFRPHEIDELYDLEHDPDELHNRADDPSLAEVLRDLRFELLGWMRRNSDPAFKGAASLLMSQYGWDTVKASTAYES